MRVICRGRKSNRTTELIEMCGEAQKRGELSYIVTHSHSDAYRIATKATEMGLSIPFPIRYDEFLDYGSANTQNILIDNADAFLQFLCSRRSPGAKLIAIVVERSDD